MQTILTTSERQTSPYRWVILFLTFLTGFLVIGFQSTGLPALFGEIATSLELDLVQIGLVWGVGSLMGIFTTVIGGSLIDYFGTRRSLVTLCFALGIIGALRGIAVDFWTIFLFSFFVGMVQPVVPLNLVKLNRQWFASHQLGLANGIMSGGFALGLMLGARLSATVLSPLLGGWREVLFLFGLVTILMSIIWLVMHPPMEKTKAKRPNIKQIFANLRMVTRYRELWVIAVAGFGVGGLMRGLVGYVPIYLREIGWDTFNADTAMTVFFLASLIGVVPISYISDRIGDRFKMMIIATTMMSIGTTMMFLAGSTFWTVILAMVIAGCCFDGFMAMRNASITEVEGLDMVMVGSALGFGGMLTNIAGTTIPPLGNSLSTIGLNVPFLLWACSGLLAMTVLVTYRITKKTHP